MVLFVQPIYNFSFITHRHLPNCMVIIRCYGLIIKYFKEGVLHQPLHIPTPKTHFAN
jgi:hypothetical protein